MIRNQIEVCVAKEQNLSWKLLRDGFNFIGSSVSPEQVRRYGSFQNRRETCLMSRYLSGAN